MKNIVGKIPDKSVLISNFSEFAPIGEALASVSSLGAASEDSEPSAFWDGSDLSHLSAVAQILKLPTRSPPFSPLIWTVVQYSVKCIPEALEGGGNQKVHSLSWILIHSNSMVPN